MPRVEARRTGSAPRSRRTSSCWTATLVSGPAAVSSILERVLWALVIGFLYFFIFVVALALVRRVWIAVGGHRAS